MSLTKSHNTTNSKLIVLCDDAWCDWETQTNIFELACLFGAREGKTEDTTFRDNIRARYFSGSGLHRPILESFFGSSAHAMESPYMAVYQYIVDNFYKGKEI